MASHLHLLRNGPLHNTLLTTAEIVDRSGVALRDDAQRVLAHVAEYRWTPETVVGEVSGNTAHVWIWRDPDGA